MLGANAFAKYFGGQMLGQMLLLFFLFIQLVLDLL